MPSQKVEFQTSDHVKIAAEYYSAPSSSPKGIVLAHMMPATKESWQEFATELQQVNFHVLAIDLRGHGESGGGNYREFSDEQHQASIKDLEAAVNFLKGKDVNQIYLAGASIGANLALQYLAQNPETKSVILFSAGLDYRGIETPPLAAKVQNKNKILFIGAEDDAATMGASCQEIIQKLSLAKSICYDSGGHGTNLLKNQPELTEKLIQFLIAN